MTYTTLYMYVSAIMQTFEGVLTAFEANLEHDAAQALMVYACLRNYNIPVELRDLIVSEVTRVNQYDAHGNKHGLWRYWYKHGKVKSDHTYDHGMQHGLWRHWYADGQLHDECNYVNGQRHGLYRMWDATGVLRTEHSWEHDKLHGLLRTWYATGELESESNYHGGQLQGLVRSWHINGELNYEHTYSQGESVYYGYRVSTIIYSITILLMSTIIGVQHWALSNSATQ